MICIFDIFFKYHYNKDNSTEIAAWLTFLGSDRPEDIIELIERYPDFKTMYEDVYTLCQNTERVMDMFSKELLELDRNTAQYMIDEMQEEINVLKSENDAVKAEIERLRQILAAHGIDADGIES